jgi:transcription initiation factor TFIID subunit 5
VRIFCGHTSSNVNCVDWHPNCNYVVTGGDDKTVRMWDIQTGRPVRLLDGCAAGINAVKVAPGGRYVAGADYGGTVHLWDLSTGKKVTQFCAPGRPERGNGQGEHNVVHRLGFSACGAALAAGGDGCVVQIWDVRRDAVADKPLIRAPARQFPTKRTILLDLFYTRRNLLMSAGKYVAPVTDLSKGAIQ